MQRILTDLLQMVEKLPVVSMRVLPESEGWRTTFVSRNIEEYGYARSALLRGQLIWLDMIHPDERERVRVQATSLLAGGTGGFKLECRMLSPDGTETSVNVYLHAVNDREGRVRRADIMIFKRNDDSGGTDEATTELSEETRRQMAFNDIVFSLGEDLEHDPITLILSKAGGYLGVSRVILQSESDSPGGSRSLHEWLNKGIKPARMTSLARLFGNADEEIKTVLAGNSLYVLNAGAIPKNIAAEARENAILSGVVAPVQAGARCRACLRFEDLKIPRVWTDSALGFIRSVSGLVSSVLLRGSDCSDDSIFISQHPCAALLDNIGSFIFVTNPESGVILFANRPFRNLFGEDCLGREYTEFMALGPEQESEMSPPPGCARSCTVAHETCLDKTGQWLAVTRDQVHWAGGINAYLHNCYDITFKKSYEESIKRLAYLDHLTGLPNRYRCDTDLRQAMGDAGLTGKSGYLMFIDLDDFKIINDSYGHHYGDGVLVSFSSFLRENYGERNNVYRFGGDEFVLLAMDCDRDCLDAYLDGIMDRAQKPWKSLNREFYCSLSIGVVEVTPDASDPKKLLQQADIAMYEAKRGGKGNYAFYAEGLGSAVLERSEMEWLLREAMENDFQGFEIHYQPYSRASDLKILGAEALIRLRDRAGNLLLPKFFMPLAEYLGFIVPLGEHVLRAAAMQCKAVNDAGLPDFSVTVNLSSRQFRQQNIVERLEEILRSTGVNFTNIIVAINEGVAIKELRHMLRTCEIFRGHGLRVALDDFGSGTSSFINMRDLPVDIIKVSSTYIDDYQDDYSGYFIRLVAELSHLSGKSVCLNGVEQEAHYRFCKELGLDMVQGFLFHRPGTVNALESLLK